MLGENIKNLRKAKGYSQETLASQLHVVRQTISKWEKGISVPDAEMLHRISELFEVSVSDLLGSEIPNKLDKSEEKEIAEQLAILNEQLANRTMRKRIIMKRIAIGIFLAIFVFVFVNVMMISAFMISGSNSKVEKEEVHTEKTIDK